MPSAALLPLYSSTSRSMPFNVILAVLLKQSLQSRALHGVIDSLLLLSILLMLLRLSRGSTVDRISRIVGSESMIYLGVQKTKFTIYQQPHFIL